jgi:hypothetical protein
MFIKGEKRTPISLLAELGAKSVFGVLSTARSEIGVLSYVNSFK